MGTFTLFLWAAITVSDPVMASLKPMGWQPVSQHADEAQCVEAARAAGLSDPKDYRCLRLRKPVAQVAVKE